MRRRGPWRWTVGQRVILHASAAGAAVVVCVSVSVAAMQAFDLRLTRSLEEYQQLRGVFELGRLLGRMQQALRGGDVASARQLVLMTRASLAVRTPEGVSRGRPEAAPAELREAVREQLEAAGRALESGAGGRGNADVTAAGAAINRAMNAVAAEASETRQRLRRLEAEARASWRAWLATVVGVGAAALGLLVLLSWRHLRAITRPLARLGAATSELAAGNLRGRAPEAGDREWVELAERFNRMADRLEAHTRDLEDRVRRRSVQLARSERLAAVGLLAAGVAHEINNPLGIIAGSAEMAERDLDALERDIKAAERIAGLRRRLSVVLDEAFRGKTVTQRLMALGRPASPSSDGGAGDGAGGAREIVDVDAVLDDAMALVGAEAQRRGAVLVREPASTGEGGRGCILAVRAEVEQVLVNLLLNAIQATSAAQRQGAGGAAGERSGGSGGEVRCRVEADGDGVMLVVEDDGVGLSESELERIFEPYFSKRGESEPAAGSGAELGGAGLGLTVTQAIVSDQGGTIEATSAGPGRGARLTVRWPAASGAEASTPIEPGAATPARERSGV